MIGETILHYKILEKLGEGGMGKVFKARDTKLDRNVALKFLPSQITATSEVKARFIHEAKTVAALNHPNIATIHAIEETENEIFIVMEYIDGIELKDKIISGPISIDEVTRIAIQIANGLKAAHKKDIIHRDIKSKNIMIMNDGTVKIMDFGLAKVQGVSQFTKLGTAIGTVSYMSPEQAKGAKVDKRTDIWSFGVVLYEMLTGELPFKGDYDQAVIYSVMNKELVYPQKILSKVNSNIIQIINKALEKEQDNRYQTINDIIVDLKVAQGNAGMVLKHSRKKLLRRSNIDEQKYSTFYRKKVLLRNKVIQISAGIIFIVIVLFFVLWYKGSSLPEINSGRSVSTLQPPVSQFSYAGISPDGKMLAIPGSDVNGNWDIYLMDIKSGESRKLETKTSTSIITKQIGAASFSPDGSTILFDKMNHNTNVEEVCKISVLGGIVRTVADTGIGLEWGPEGERIYYFRGKPRAPSRSGWREYWSVASDGTDTRLKFIDSLSQGTDNNFTFSLSPNGNKAAFTRPFKGGYNEIIIRNFETGKETRLTYDHKIINDVVWLNNGYILYNSERINNSNIWIIPEVGGNAKQITSDAGYDDAMTVSLAANRLIFQQAYNEETLWKVNIDGSDDKQVFPDANIHDATYSPDGKKVAVIITNPSGIGNSLVIRELKSGQQETLIPFNSSFYRIHPQWSPSGTFISYLEFPKGPYVSIPKIKLLNLSEGKKPRDFGYGAVVRWLNDSVIVIKRVSGKLLVNYKRMGGRGKTGPDASSKDHLSYSYRLLNINTGLERKFFRDSVYYVTPVLNGNKYLYAPARSKEVYIVSKKELEKDPEAKGKILFNGNQIHIGTISNQWMYYTAKGAIWAMNLKTLKKSRVISLPSGIFVILCEWGYNDKVVAYLRMQRKENLIKIDNLFMKN